MAGTIFTSIENIEEKYAADTYEEQREKLNTFFWNKVLQEGALYGNRNKKSYVNVKNPINMTYPGIC